MSYSVLAADMERDSETILGLWSRNLPEAARERYPWLYTAGPAIGWIARDEAGCAVGSTGLMHRKVKLLNETVAAGQAVDMNVDRGHRSLGPAMALQRAVTGMVGNGKLRMVYALPNDRSEPVLHRAGYRAFGQLQRWAKPLVSEPLLRTRLRWSVVRRPLAGAIDSVLKIRSPEMWTRPPQGLYFHRIYRFDPRFDDLWHTAGPRFPVAGERTGAYLDWRWRQNPGLKHEIVGLCDRESRLLAYAVYSRRGNVVYLDDFLFSEIWQLEQVLAELLRIARRTRAEALITVYLGSPQVEALLERFGFWRRPGHWNALVYVDPRHPASADARIYDSANWHLTRADLDTDFLAVAGPEVNSRSATA